VWVLGERQLIRELKLGGVNHDRMRKWEKTVYMPESNIKGRPSHHKKRQIPLLKFNQS
jgi:hypothetical protein